MHYNRVETGIPKTDISKTNKTKKICMERHHKSPQKDIWSELILCTNIVLNWSANVQFHWGFHPLWSALCACVAILFFSLRLSVFYPQSSQGLHIHYLPTYQPALVVWGGCLLEHCMTHVGLFLQQFEHASVTGTGSYVIDTLSCQQQRKMYDRGAAMRRGGRKRSWEGGLLVE